MSGQGSPSRRLLRALEKAVALSLLVCVTLLVCLACESAFAADPIDVRVRLAWGGGEARSWQGTLQLSSGVVSEIAPLGLESDTPGSMLLVNPTTVRVFTRGPRSYDGCDLHIQAPADAKLLVQLDADPNNRRSPIEIPLARIIHELVRQNLDDKNNHLLAQRSPGDTLRVSFARSSLIFSSGEKFELTAAPQPLELSPNSTYVLSATLGPARTEDNTWSEEKEFRAESGTALTPIPLTVPLPEQEGVYDLRLAVFPKRITPALLRGKPVATRKVQLVVMSPIKTATQAQPAWQPVLEFDPASPKWWEQVARLPAWTRLPTTPRPVESRPGGIRAHQGKNWVELAPRAWQAYPLSMSAVGKPHIVEIEYPSDLEQTLSISIVEPNAAGYVGPVGLDSGIEVSRPDADHHAGVRRHELMVWPQTRAPYLLLVNRRDETPAVFGKIAIKSGPNSLTPLAIPAVTYSGRQLAAYYDKPLFAENFSSPEAVESLTRKGLDDWITFGAGAERLIETLQHGGYNALVLTAACDGSSIYPSRLLEPTPEYDSGTFFESGQDPVRKDVLELLFRLCDRSGIVLIPGVQFGGPLPELEKIRLNGGNEAVGLEPIGPDGRTWLGRGNRARGAGVYYNPLDDRVQQAMVAVVRELAERYGHHASFGGVSVQLSSDTHALLPDETCSLDDVTFARFLTETNMPSPTAIAANPPERMDFIYRTAYRPWLEWRTEKMSGLYRQMREAVAQQRDGAKLYLTPAHLLTGKQLQFKLRPELPPVDKAVELLPLLGLDLNRLAESDIVVPRPQRLTPLTSPSIHDQEVHWNRNPALDSLFAKAAHRTSIHFLAPAPLRLPDFDATSPFGADKTRTLLISQILPADAAYRERFVESLARFDTALIMDGGWLLPMGQHSALAPLAKVYRRLPAEAFTAIAQSGQPLQRTSPPQECVVRTLSKGDKTYFYAVNPTPWPQTVQIQFAAAQTPRITPYNEERSAKLQNVSGGVEWSVQMEPFDLVGGEISSAQASVAKWSVTPPASAATLLAEQGKEISRRANFLRDNSRAVTLFNPSFEVKTIDGGPAGWQFATDDAGLKVSVESRASSGLSDALHLSRSGTAKALWVRSTPIAAPTTGRLQMQARIRIAEGATQPQLRLAIEGKVDGQPYYRRKNCGAMEADGAPVPPLVPGQWTTQTIALADLPTSGITELCVGFDLMSDGEVWIDDVQVRDLWLNSDEYNELIKCVFTANQQAKSGSLNEARLFVDGYWPSFLRRNVQLPDGQNAPTTSAGATAPRKPASGITSILPTIPTVAKAKDREKEKEREKEIKKPWWSAERVRNWWK